MNGLIARVKFPLTEYLMIHEIRLYRVELFEIATLMNRN